MLGMRERFYLARTTCGERLPAGRMLRCGRSACTTRALRAGVCGIRVCPSVSTPLFSVGHDRRALMRARPFCKGELRHHHHSRRHLRAGSTTATYPYIAIPWLSSAPASCRVFLDENFHLYRVLSVLLERKKNYSFILLPLCSKINF